MRGVYNRGMDFHGDYPSQLPRAELFALIDRAQAGDKDARNLAIVHNMRLVVHISRGWSVRYPHIERDDLIQAGSFGLADAVMKFETSRGLAFATYANPWITRAIREYVDSNLTVLTIPYNIAGQARRGNTGTNKLDAAAMAIRTRSIESRTPDDAQLHIPDASPSAEDLCQNASVRKLARAFLSELAPRQRTVIEARFGLETDEELTLKELGAMFGLSRERIRQIELQALGELHAMMRQHGIRSNGHRRRRQCRSLEPRCSSTPDFD